MSLPYSGKKILRLPRILKRGSLIRIFSIFKQYSDPGPEVIKLFSCSTQLSIKFFLFINVKMPTNVGIITFMSGKNSILGLSEPTKS